MILFSLDLGCMIRALSNIKHGKEHIERKSYFASAAKHEQIVEALPRLSAAKLRGLMRDSLSCWRNEILDELLAGEP